MVNVPQIKLNDGTIMPGLGLGTYTSSNNDGEFAVKYAIDAGYRHFDTAFLYANEKEVGKALREKISEGVVTRDELFVVTKLWNTFHDEDKVEYACRKSLENLGLDYIDLYVMHFPMGFVHRSDEDFMPQDDTGNFLTNDVDYVVTYRAMEKLVKLGLVKSLGISNFNSEQIGRILGNCEIKPVNNQIECSPNINQKKLIKFCKDRDIVVTAYCPLGRPNVEKRTPDFMFDAKVEEIGKKYNKTSAQVVLRYLSTNNDCEIAVKYAVDAGYRHFDTAFVYGNEQEIGKALREKIADGIVTRDELFVVTKLASTFHEEDKVEYACRKSLENLGLDYIDLYLMHFPIGFVYRSDEDLMPQDDAGNFLSNDVDYVVTYRAMEKLVRLGLVKSLGISNFNSEQTARLLENCEIKPVNNQIECSLHINQKKLIKFCKDRDIVVTAYCPLGRPNVEKRTPNFMFDENIKEIGKKYNKTSAQVILRYLFEHGTIPLPKSVTKSRIESNIDIFDFQLSNEDTLYLDSFNTNHRIVGLPQFSGHKYYPFDIEY